MGPGPGTQARERDPYRMKFAALSTRDPSFGATALSAALALADSSQSAPVAFPSPGDRSWSAEGAALLADLPAAVVVSAPSLAHAAGTAATPLSLTRTATPSNRPPNTDTRSRATAVTPPQREAAGTDAPEASAYRLAGHAKTFTTHVRTTPNFNHRQRSLQLAA